MAKRTQPPTLLQVPCSSSEAVFHLSSQDRVAFLARLVRDWDILLSLCSLNMLP